MPVHLQGKKIRFVNETPFGHATKIIDPETGNDLIDHGIAGVDIHIGKRVEVTLTLYKAGLDIVGEVVGQKINEDSYRIIVPDTHDVRVLPNPKGGQVVFFERKR